MNTEKTEFGPWMVWFDPPPIPSRDADWHYQNSHDESDSGSAPSLECALALIVESQAEEIGRLRTILSEIAMSHTPSQPMSSDDDEAVWVMKHVAHLRWMALKA